MLYMNRPRRKQPGLNVGPISRKMIRNTNSDHGRYTIYTVVLMSFLGIALCEVLGVPYEIGVLILTILLMVVLLNMNRIVRWTRERRQRRFQANLADRRKDLPR